MCFFFYSVFMATWQQEMSLLTKIIKMLNLETLDWPEISQIGASTTRRPM